MKKFLCALTVILILTVLLACGSESEPQQVFVPTPAPTEAPTPEPEPTPVFVAEATPNEEPVITAPPTEEPKTLPPIPTDTPAPTPTPEPTPVPTPTPIPYRADQEAKMLKTFAIEGEPLKIVGTRGQSPSILMEPDPAGEQFRPFTSLRGVYRHEWILLDTVETETRTYAHIRAIGSDAEGYIDARSLIETNLTEPESIYAVMVRPKGIVYSARTFASPIAGHVDYGVLRVIGVDTEKGYAAVLTGDGKTGYVQFGQIRFLSEEDFRAMLRQSVEAPESVFSTGKLLSDALTYLGEPYADSAAFLYELLCSEGLHFNEVYYRYYQKPLDDETLYPKHLYVTPVYNTLLFKLFNSAGDLVTCDGEETEWEYIGSLDEVEEGDLLFFAEEFGKGDAVIPDVEVVVHGQYSGDLTGCGLYLGDGRMLTVRDGFVADVEIDQISAHSFDSARRIHPSVVDERAHFIECMISMIYDRLGTPYNSVRRIGDESYDCSGLLCWVFRNYDYYRAFPIEPSFEITAAAWSQVEELISPTKRIRFVDTGISREKESFDDLRRGDLVLLLNERRDRTGHVMVYLGNNTVIHSTRIDGRYQGTLVARFRPHLQNLYACSRRISEILPLN